MDYFKASLELHRKFKGKIAIHSKMPVRSKDDLATVYSPGVAEPCRAIAADPEAAYEYTIKGNTGLQLTLNDNSKILFGTNKKEELSNVIKTLNK